MSLATGYNEQVVEAITNEFQKQILYALNEEDDHKVVLKNFMTFTLKPPYKPGTVRLGKPVSPLTMRIIGKITSNMSRSISKIGYVDTLKEIWGDKND